MTPEQIALVRRSFAALDPSKEDLASEFYQQLFALDPSLRNLCTGDRESQQAEFTKQLAAIVDSLDDFEELVDLTHDIGRHCAECGVRVSHYRTGRTALVAALETTLGDRLDPSTRKAWTLATNLVAECMMAAAMKR